jgi:hypothetical protein
MKGDVYHGNEPSPRDWVVKRVQIPAYHDMWMRGDRYGDVVSVRYAVRSKREIATVKLDISGKTVKVVLDDCTVVS